MNQVYKVVFNKATGVFVAVAEYARGQGKKSNRSGVDHPASHPIMQSQTDSSLSQRFGLAALTAALLTVSGTSMAADYEDYLEVNNAGTGNEIASAGGIGAVAFGVNAQAKTDKTTAIGSNASSNGVLATSIGYNSKAGGNNATAIGENAKAGGASSVSIGSEAATSGTESISIGNDAFTSADQSIAVGASTKSNKNGVSIGYKSQSLADEGSTSLGSSTLSMVNNGVALGSHSYNDRKSLAKMNYQGKDVTTIDVLNKADETEKSIYLDNQVYSLDMSNKNDKDVIIGTVRGNMGAVSLGDAEGGNGSKVTRQITDLAAGSLNTDAVNVAQLKAVANVASKGINIQSNNNNNNLTNIKPGNTINFKDGNNIAITNDGNTVTVATKPDVTFNSTTIGDPKASPVIINGAGINAGNKKITNVAPGVAGKDAVNVTQLKDSRTQVTSTDKSVTIEQSEANGGFVYDLSVDADVAVDSTTIVKNKTTGELSVVTDGFNTDAEGITTAKTPTSLATSEDIASAINSSGWTATAGGSPDNATLVNPGDTVTFSSLDDTMSITNDGTDFTFATNTGAISANPDMPGSTTVTNPNGLATAGNVSTAINNAGFNLAGDMGEDNVKLGQTVKYVGSDANIETKVTDNQVGFELANTVKVGDSNPVTINGDAGTVGGLTNTSFDPDAIYIGGQAATQEQLTGAYNDAKTTVKSSDNSINVMDTNKGVGNLAYDITINNQGVVEAAQTPVVYTNVAGDKLYKQNDGSFKNDNGDTVAPADVIASMNNGAGETTTPMTLTNIQGNLDGAAPGTTAPTTSGTAPTSAVSNNAATVGDVLNSGFNLQADGEDADFVSAYDTVNLAAGNGLETEVTTDGSTTSVEYSVKTDKKTIGFDKNGNVTALTGDVIADANKPGATTTTTPNKLATAGNVSEAINNAGFNIAGDAGTDNVKLGETVTYQGTDNNIVTEVIDNEVGFSLADTVTIGNNESGNPITVNGNTGNIGGLTNTTFDANDFTSGQAATEDQLAQIAANRAWTLTANGGDAAQINPGNTVDFSNSDSNIEVTKTGSNVGIGLADNIVVDSVTSSDGTVSLSNTGLNNGGNKVINVAPAELSATSMDAVNGSQLYNTNQNVAGNTQNIAGNTATINKGINFGNGVTANNYKLGDTIGVVGDENITSTTTTAGVQVSLNDNITVDSVTAGNTSLSTNGINAGGNTITNVAPGVEGTDAANVDQLKALDDKINNIDDHQDEANAGISSAMAMASLPQAYLPGKSMVTGGMASYDGEGAVAVGLSKLTDNGRWVFKISGSADTEGNAGGAVGAGMHF